MYILERLLSWSTSRIRQSWSRPRIRLNLLPALFHTYLSCLSWPTYCSTSLFVPTIHVSHVYLSLTTGRLNTSKQYDHATSHIQRTLIYISHKCYYSSFSSYFLHTLGQAGWPESLMSGTNSFLVLEVGRIADLLGLGAILSRGFPTQKQCKQTFYYTSTRLGGIFWVD